MITHHRHLSILVASSAVLLASAFGSSADDAGLYEKPIDPHSAFVRVISPGSAIASVMSSSFSGLDSGVSPYVAVAPGDIIVSSSLAEGKVSATAGKFYTAILSKAGTVTLEDDVTTNPAKASLTVYNLSSLPELSLFVPQAKADAVSKVSAGHAKTVALRAPLKVSFVVTADGRDLAALDSVEFKRSASVTIIVVDSNGSVAAVAVPSTIAR